MQNRHQNRSKYFDEQSITTRNFVVPFIEQSIHLNKETKILEIGCGEGGNLIPFIELGCQVTGIDISANKINNARQFLKKYQGTQALTLLCDDIYKQQNIGVFDVIILRDVIEHITNQERFMGFLINLMKNESLVFFAFPPWHNPFGGHQQICRNKILSRLPYFHLLPNSIYKQVLKTFGESKATINSLTEIKATGISIERFERIIRHNNYRINDKVLYLINPNYKIKFGLKPRKQLKLIGKLPYLRNFLSTAAYYLISANHAN